MVIFTGIKQSDLRDPNNPPAKAKGPFVISGNNRYVCFNSHSPLSRLMLCREIIARKMHPKPDLFKKFYMSVYCFPQPKDASQVMFQLFLTVSRMFSSHRWAQWKMNSNMFTSRCSNGSNFKWCGGHYSTCVKWMSKEKRLRFGWLLFLG